MDEKKKNVPKRRFKEFKNADAWEQRELGEVVENIGTGKSKFIMNNYDTENIFPILGSTGVIGFDNQYDYEGEFVLTARVGANAGTLYKYKGYVKISDNTVFIQNERHNFIYFLLSYFDLKKLSFGTGQPLIKASELKKLKLYLPIDQEQEKIETILLNLDNTITLHQRKLNKYKAIKESYLQEMFPAEGQRKPKRRFPGFTDDWEQRELGEITKVNSGRDYKHLKSGNIPVYGTGGLMLYVDKALSMDRDAIGIGRKGTINNPYILRSPFWTVDTLFYVIPNENYNLYFTYKVFEKINWKAKDESTGVPSLSKQTINNTKVFIPLKNEQDQIGKIFEELDQTITLHQKKLEKLKKLKEALLEEMFV